MRVATAEATYADPSALARLYLHQTGSRELSAWRHRHRGPLPVTHHGRTEIVNAISLAAFRGAISSSLPYRPPPPDWRLFQPADDILMGRGTAHSLL
jgi:hypothetical protein